MYDTKRMGGFYSVSITHFHFTFVVPTAMIHAGMNLGIPQTLVSLKFYLKVV